MKATIQYIMLAVSVLATGIAHSHSTLLDEYGNQIKGAAYVTCTFGIEYGKQVSKVSAVDRSHDRIPTPDRDSSCAQYSAKLMESGARVDTTNIACYDLDSPHPPPDRLCLFVIAATYGPGVLW